MGPVLALKYFRYTYRSSKINILQQAERLGGPILSLGNIEPQARSLEKDVSPLSISQPKNRNPVYEPLLSESPNSTRRSLGPGATFDFFQSQSRLSSSYSRNCKDNWLRYIYMIIEGEIIGDFRIYPSTVWLIFVLSIFSCPFLWIRWKRGGIVIMYSNLPYF